MLRKLKYDYDFLIEKVDLKEKAADYYSRFQTAYYKYQELIYFAKEEDRKLVINKDNIIQMMDNPNDPVEVKKDDLEDLHEDDTLIYERRDENDADDRQLLFDAKQQLQQDKEKLEELEEEIFKIVKMKSWKEKNKPTSIYMGKR